MVIRATRFFLKMAQFGPRWAHARLVDEFSYPTSHLSRWLRRVLWRPRAVDGSREGFEDTLVFPYDLALYPITFDFVTYLAGAEMERRRRGLSHLAVFIVPGIRELGRVEEPDYDRSVDAVERRWRIENILLPVAGLLPSVSLITVAKDREQLRGLALESAPHRYRQDYRLDLPVQAATREICDLARKGETVLPMLETPVQARRIAGRFLRTHACGKHVLVISLRAYAFSAARNSDLAAWAAFAAAVPKDKYHVVVVPEMHDPAPTGYDVDGVTLYPAAAFNIQVRAALYELADLVMGASQGPFELCWLNHRCRYVVFLKANTTAQNTFEAMADHGFERDKPPPYAVEDQVWNWGMDDLESINAEFEKIRPRVEAQPPRYSVGC